MHRIFLPIDTKSLYRNILNDNLKGHTCTVATPLKQGNTINERLSFIFRVPKQIDYQQYPGLIDQLIKNSKSQTKINNVFVFDKIKVNGEIVECNKLFCMYLKEEIDPSKAQFGRIKLHYPTSLVYPPLNIDNRSVVNAVSEKLFDYAFVVNGFEYDFDDDSLGFATTIVGYGNIPYSKVFRNTKGVGEKFTKAFKRTEECYDSEIVSLKRAYGDEVTPSNFQTYMEKALCESIDVVQQYLSDEGAIEFVCLSREYPYSLFDIQYCLDGKIYYGIVKTTYTRSIYMDLSSEELRALAVFPSARLFLVSEIFSKNVVRCFTKEDIDSLRHVFTSVRLIA